MSKNNHIKQTKTSEFGTTSGGTEKLHFLHKQFVKRKNTTLDKEILLLKVACSVIWFHCWCPPVLPFPPVSLSRKYFQNLLVQLPVSELQHSSVRGTKPYYYKYFSYNISKDIRLAIMISCWLSPENFKFPNVAVDSEDKSLIFFI